MGSGSVRQHLCTVLATRLPHSWERPVCALAALTPFTAPSGNVASISTASSAIAGLHKRWVERKLELEVGKVQAKLMSKGIAIPDPKPDDVEASTRLAVAHLPKLHVDMYGRNPNGTHKASPERLQRGSAASKQQQSVVERLERMMNPGVMGGLPDELAAAYGLPRSPRCEVPELSPNGAAHGWRRGSGTVTVAAGAGGLPPGSPSHPRGGVQTSLGSPRLSSPRSGSPGATGSLGAHGHSYSNPISAAAASAALARHGKAAAGHGGGGAGPHPAVTSHSGAVAGAAADAAGEVGAEAPEPPSPVPVQLRPDLEGADARIEGAMLEVERVTLPVGAVVGAADAGHRTASSSPLMDVAAAVDAGCEHGCVCGCGCVRVWVWMRPRSQGQPQPFWNTDGHHKQLRLRTPPPPCRPTRWASGSASSTWHARLTLILSCSRRATAPGWLAATTAAAAAT